MTACAVGLSFFCPEAAPAEDIDDEHLFGFTQGTDIGRKGDKEVELEAHGRFGKRQGTYSAVSPGIEGKFTILDDVRVSPGIAMAHHHIGAVPGLDGRSGSNLDGLSFETKVRLLDRTRNPFGVTVGVTPAWGRTDPTSGETATSYGVGFLFSIDRELVPGQLFSAFNATYDPVATRSRVTGGWSHDSSVGLSGAIAHRVHDGIFLGAEVRYARAHDALDLDRFSGHALFVGPTFYAKLSDTVWIAAAWNLQVAGRSNDEQAMLDLSNFERHEVAVRLGIAF